MSRKKPNGTPQMLPRAARDFLSSLESTLKRTTCRHYRSSLRSFYRFLQNRRLPITQVQRRHLELWYHSLYTAGLSPSARGGQIQHVCRYFEWLYDNDQIQNKPRLLFRKEDFPKVTKRLPRPFPPEIDRELIARLQRSTCRYHWGLLLLRYTGMRIGELLVMPWDCLRTDDRGLVFIKVPPGKLDKERLVPLDTKAQKLVRDLQRLAPLPRAFLLQYPNGGKVHYNHLRQQLKDISGDLITSEPITSHRFRHTYATTLLNAGASLETIMRLLGHLDIHMTLNYAELTQHTVTKEFFAAIQQLEQEFSVAQKPNLQNGFDPRIALNDLACWFKAEPALKIQAKTKRSLLKHLTSIANQIEKILPDSTSNNSAGEN